MYRFYIDNYILQGSKNAPIFTFDTSKDGLLALIDT